MHIFTNIFIFIKISVINILKKILITNDGCYTHCKHSYYEKNIGTVCNFENKCENHSMYEIDYDKLNKDYDIN